MNRGRKSAAGGSKVPASVPRVAPPSSSSSSGTAGQPSTTGAIQTLIKSYQSNTPARLKLIDAFCVFLIVLGVLQFVYCVAITNFPFNSFVAGFTATVGQFVLAASLRIQVNKANAKDFQGMSPERAFADFVFGSIVLHFFVVNFLG